MYNTRASALIGALYLMPIVLFVLCVHRVSIVQMIWMSFHNWSLMETETMGWLGQFYSKHTMISNSGNPYGSH